MDAKNLLAGLALALLSSSFVVGATVEAFANHRIVLMNSKAYDDTKERWPGIDGALTKDDRGMKNAADRGLIKASPLRSHYRKVWKAIPTYGQIAEGIVATASTDIWSKGITQISTRLDTGEQAAAYYYLWRRDKRVPYRIGWHMEQHALPTVGGEASEVMYPAIGYRGASAEYNGWVWELGVGSEGDGDSVARACLGDQLPALPGKEEFVKGQIEVCPPWVKGDREHSSPHGHAMLNALESGWRMVGLHGVGGQMIVYFGERLEDVMKKNPDLTLDYIRNLRHGFSHGTMLGKTPALIETALKWNLYLPVDVYRSFTDETAAIEDFYGPEGFEFQAPIKSLLDAGVKVMSDYSTWQDVGTMVHRRHPATEQVMEPEERVDRVTAFKLATIIPAEFNFSETVSGSLEVGKFADFQIVAQNFLGPAAVPDVEIDNINVLMTIVGDEVVWTSEKASKAWKSLPHFYGREYLGPNKVPGRQQARH
jgi:predicted amidohydrolase YtcJ